VAVENHPLSRHQLWPSFVSRPEQKVSILHVHIQTYMKNGEKEVSKNYKVTSWATRSATTGADSIILRIFSVKVVLLQTWLCPGAKVVAQSGQSGFGYSFLGFAEFDRIFAFNFNHLTPPAVAIWQIPHSQIGEFLVVGRSKTHNYLRFDILFIRLV
jgi:hypothetical protein